MIAARCKKCGTIGCGGNNIFCKKDENIGLMKEYNTLEEITALVKSIPNDMELGRAVRELFS